MIHILLLILKIIGIVLLAILFLVLLILFFPIAYKINGTLKKKDYVIKVTAKWLFGIVYFGLLKDKKTEKYELRILGISVKKYPQKTKQKSNAAEREKGVPESREVIRKEHRETIKEDATRKEHVKNDTSATENAQKTKNESTEKAGKITSFIKKVKQFFRKLFLKIKILFENIKDGKDKIAEIKNFISANTTKEAYRYGKRVIIRLLKYIFPKKISGNIHFGFEKPDLTGKALGYFAIGFSTFHINPKHITIEPDFENQVFDGNVKIKGRFMAGVVGIYLLKLYVKKEIRSIIKQFS